MRLLNSYVTKGQTIQTIPGCQFQDVHITDADSIAAGKSRNIRLVLISRY